MLTSHLQRRHALLWPCLAALPTWAIAAAPKWDSMLSFDAAYIPALFLSGNGGKSPDAAAKATAAMKRLIRAWPAHRRSMEQSVPASARWRGALAEVDRHLADADKLLAAAQWERSHEALEHVRETLYDVRQSLGLDYPLDVFTAFHQSMEKLAGAKKAARPQMEKDFATARAQWHRIEMQSFDATAYGLTPERARQLAQARADESAALARLSESLNGASDADLLRAAAAIKPPFVRAYIAFGSMP